jgi:pimeloyl-ACP methyl ester carboxylesterase
MTESTPHSGNRRRTLRRRAGFALILIAIGWAGSTLAVTWALTHRFAPERAETPRDIGDAPRTDLTLKTADGETLGAWLFEGRPDRPSAIVMHGNNGCRSHCRSTIEMLARQGCAVLAVSLRAHGDSTGSVNDIGWSARRDIVAAVELLEDRFPGRPIVVCGRSMSSAAAIFAARELGARVDGYWLEQPYNSLETAAWRRLQQQLPPVFDLAAYAGMKLWSSVLLPVSLAEIAPASCICDVPENCPLVILSGDADGNLPLADVEEVVNNVRDRARLVVFKGAGHHDMPETNPDLYEQELAAFLAEVVRRSQD